MSNYLCADIYGCDNLTAVYFTGNAPTQNEDEFYGDPATAYFLLGTIGWSNFTAQADALAKLWNPIIQGSGPNFGVSNGQFGFNITGNSNLPIAVEACTNLANPVWMPLTNMTLTNGSVYFSDPNWTNFPVRYYGIGFP
jgi:hypothetical protein